MERGVEAKLGEGQARIIRGQRNNKVKKKIRPKYTYQGPFFLLPSSTRARAGE
jgi:hypothetical protein